MIGQENGKSRLQQAQDDVEEVKGIMLDNMNKADERGDKLNDLEDRADELLEKSKTFEKTTRKLKQKYKGTRKLVFISVGVVAALIIIGLIIFAIV
nr:vesicle-associated membrane protein 1-like isoform X1 [Labrus bergylta]